MIRIHRVYSTDRLSALPAEARRDWMARRLNPYVRRHWWRNALGRLPLRKLVRLAWFKLRRKVLRKVRLPRTAQEGS